MNNKTIGGEFEVSPDLLKKTDSQINYFNADYLFSSGRTALYYILLNETSEKVYTPDYMCPCVNETIKTAGKQLIKYHVNDKFEPAVSKTNEYVIFLLVNYFGLCAIDESIILIRKNMPNAVIVLDDVQALWDLKQKHEVDYTFSSYRKWLPVPDGAPVVTKRQIICDDLSKNTFSKHKIIGSLLKYYRYFDEIDDNDYLKFFESGEYLLDKDWNCKTSSFSLNILTKLNYDDIQEQRRINYAYLLTNLPFENFSGGGTFVEYNLLNNKYFVPMFLPIFSENRNDIRKKLMEHNIFCPIHWSIKNELAKKELSIVCDQRYTIDDMNRIIKVVKECF